MVDEVHRLQQQPVFQPQVVADRLVVLQVHRIAAQHGQTLRGARSRHQRLARRLPQSELPQREFHVRRRQVSARVGIACPEDRGRRAGGWGVAHVAAELQLPRSEYRRRQRERRPQAARTAAQIRVRLTTRKLDHAAHHPFGPLRTAHPRQFRQTRRQPQHRPQRRVAAQRPFPVVAHQSPARGQRRHQFNAREKVRQLHRQQALHPGLHGHILPAGRNKRRGPYAHRVRIRTE